MKTNSVWPWQEQCQEKLSFNLKMIHNLGKVATYNIHGILTCQRHVHKTITCTNTYTRKGTLNKWSTWFCLILVSFEVLSHEVLASITMIDTLFCNDYNRFADSHSYRMNAYIRKKPPPPRLCRLLALPTHPVGKMGRGGGGFGRMYAFQ